MARRLFTIIAVASAVLCAATIALWAASHRQRPDFTLTLGRDDREVAVVANDGEMSVTVIFVTPHAGASVEFFLPLAAAVAATAVVPVAWVAWRVLRRRPAAGLCPACGYDLRASPGRCPECGAEPRAATQ